MINAGSLKDRIALYKNTSVQNGSGGNTFVKVKYLDTFAEVTEIKSDPTLIASQEDVKQVVKVVIRYRTDVTIVNGDLMQWRGFEFVLNNFVVDPRRTTIEMMLTMVINTTNRTSVEPVSVDTFDDTFDDTFK